MKIVFICTGVEQLGIGMLSAILKKQGHRTELAFHPAIFGDRGYLNLPIFDKLLKNYSSIVTQVASQNPDLVIISPVTATYRWAVTIASQIKSEVKNVKIALGGPHVSAVPEIAISDPAIDAIGIGEGENAILEYVQVLNENRPIKPINNLWYKTSDGRIIRGSNSPFIADLDSLPFSDKKLFENTLDLGSPYYIMAGRGCPYRCAYCINSFWANLPDKPSGPYLRFRSPDHILEELRLAKKRYAPKYVEFFDDILTTDQHWLKVFLKEYKKEIGIPFLCQTHPYCVDENIANILRDAGCIKVTLGIQAIDDSQRTKMLGRQESRDRIQTNLSFLEKAGIPYRFDRILGLSGESMASHEQALEFYSKLKPYRISTFWLKYYPGTKITKNAVEEGILSADDLEQIANGEMKSFYIPTVSDTETEKKLLRYDILFKGLPIVGNRLTRIFTEEMALAIPRDILRTSAIGIDILASLINRNPDLKVWGRFYFLNMLSSIKFSLKRKLKSNFTDWSSD